MNLLDSELRPIYRSDVISNLLCIDFLLLFSQQEWLLSLKVTFLLPVFAVSKVAVSLRLYALTVPIIHRSETEKNERVNIFHELDSCTWTFDEEL